MSKFVRLVLFVTAAMVSAAAPIAAQSLNIGGSSSHFGRTSLAPGFTPDPFAVSVVSGGDIHVPSQNLASGCVGYATATPDYIIDITGPMDYLSIYVEGNGDTGLVINDANGGWSCDDDGHTGTNPKVTLYNAPAGQYDIWISSYTSGESISGTLHLTEIR